MERSSTTIVLSWNLQDLKLDMSNHKSFCQNFSTLQIKTSFINCKCRLQYCQLWKSIFFKSGCQGRVLRTILKSESSASWILSLWILDFCYIRLDLIYKKNLGKIPQSLGFLEVKFNPCADRVLLDTSGKPSTRLPLGNS